jgi:hypothetical protein
MLKTLRLAIGQGPGQELTVRVAQSVVDTAVAKIASKQRPKPMVLTTTADYRTRLRTKKLSQFLLAQLHQAHGQFSNAWALGEAVFRDCCLWDAGVVKVRADASLGRVV